MGALGVALYGAASKSADRTDIQTTTTNIIKERGLDNDVEDLVTEGNIMLTMGELLEVLGKASAKSRSGDPDPA